MRRPVPEGSLVAIQHPTLCIDRAEKVDVHTYQAKNHVRDGNLHLAQKLVEEHGLDPEILEQEPPPATRIKIQAAADLMAIQTAEQIRGIGLWYSVPRDEAQKIFEGEARPPAPGPHKCRQQLQREINRQYSLDPGRPFE